jgi:hypothetical protein
MPTQPARAVGVVIVVHVSEPDGASARSPSDTFTRVSVNVPPSKLKTSEGLVCLLPIEFF